jgi:hypothetical protein
MRIVDTAVVVKKKMMIMMMATTGLMCDAKGGGHYSEFISVEKGGRGFCISTEV